MRATEGVRQMRTWRKFVVLAATLGLSLSLIGSGTVLGANPSWTTGHGSDYTLIPAPTSGASSSAVSAGSEVGFFEWLHNGDTSNISQLYLNATTQPSATVAGAVWTIKNASDVVVRSGTCPTATPLVCSFGALNAGNTVYVVAAFTIGGNVADNTVQNATFNFNTTGTPPGKNQSHGDAKVVTDSVLVTKNGDAAGDFNLNDVSITVADNQSLNGQNRQATSASVSAFMTGVAVGDSPNLVTPCDTTLTVGFPAWFDCSQLTSLTSVVEVGNGKIFQNTSGGPGIKVLITFSKAPNQLSGSNPFVYHYWVDAAGAHAELITATCDSNSLPTNLTPCLIVGNKNVTVWLFHNGPMRS